ncbi:hypothetical protein SDC9_194401 [bioreactor metagenome]|uniref:Uncharacterized protein n=1 Tax=bioreactor metagenome TaxID=1076179 RepID=A0A645I7Q8_9ZZZZ
MELLGLGDGALHPQGSVGQHQFGAVGGEQFAPLDAHRLRHGQDQPVPFDRRHQRKTDTRVARGRLDDQRARLEDAGLLRRFDHRQGNPVLDRTAGIEGLHFDEDLRAALVEFVDPHERRVSDFFHDRVRDAAHNSCLLFEIIFPFNFYYFGSDNIVLYTDFL